MSSINSISTNLLQSIVGAALQSASQTSKPTAASLTPPSDSGSVSPLAKLLSTLQQLQQTNPTQYKQVTGQIATDLTTAAQSAQAAGNTTAATQLTQLSTEFTTASQTGQLPNIQDLSKAIGGGHHHHHGHHVHSGDSDGDSSAPAASTIISNALTSAGITPSNA